jgi:hypothetical protein
MADIKCMQKITVESVRAAFSPLIAAVKDQYFIKSYAATDAEALGLLISKFFQWSGEPILETAAFALEDAYFHKEAQTIRELKEAV